MRALLFLGFALVVLIAAWWLFPGDPVAALRARHAPLAEVHRTPAPELGPGIERWVMRDRRGAVSKALWRPAPDTGPGTWTVVMLGGLETGDRAALLLDGVAGVNVLAVDWPWDGPRRMSGTEVVRQIPALRAAVLRSPAPLANGIEALVREGLADSTRIALLGVSLGVPPALAALRLTSRPSALILVHGAADLELLLRHGLEPRVRPRWLAAPIAALAFRLIRPLEPAFHFEAAAGLPVLLVQARDDERLPQAAVGQLAAGFPHAEVQVLDGPHLRSTRTGLIATIATHVMQWLQGGPAKGSAPRRTAGRPGTSAAVEAASSRGSSLP